MDVESLTQMLLGSLALLLVVGLLIFGILLHRYNLESLYKRISILSKSQISRERLYEEMSQPLGSNFISAAISAWILLFVTIAYFYFLTPTMFSLNYFRIPSLASSTLGFFLFGLLAILTTGIIAAGLPRIYSFYDISLTTKKAVIATIPLLGVSLFCSAYAGTLYPLKAPILTEMIALLMLLTSEVILLSPIFIGTAEVAR
jgi:hypothetical protein